MLKSKSIKTKLLIIIVGITVMAMMVANTIIIGSTYVSDTMQGHDHWADHKWDFIIMGIGTCLAALFAYCIALKLQNILTRPIYHLSGLAVTLAEKQDYDLRAKKFHDDELGLLSDAFNAMIIGIGSAQHDIDKANKQKSDFLAMMSHEIRTPINGIVGTADLLSETALTGRQRDYVEIIEKSAETLLDLINDILDFSKIEAEKLKIENVAFDITQHIQDVIDMLQVSTGQKGLRLYFTNNIQRDAYVMGDPTRIKQILINLVSNAIKFTEKGSVTITLDEDASAPSNDVKQIWISVTDTGIGIPPDSQDQIFESFSQASDSTTRQYGGSGLGLTICKKLVTLMNGTIGLQSVEGIGSTFWFSIPMPIAERPVIAQEKSNDFHVPVENKQILFVEDNETNIIITAEMLRGMGYNPVLCRHGREAVEVYKLIRFPLILMDCQMPIMDGWEATQKIREFERDNNLPPTHIIALTANAMQGDREKCIDAGMDDYLAKPFKKRDLVEKLKGIEN